MQITSNALAAIRTGFSAAFKKGLDQAESDFDKIAFTVPSTTKETTYGWLGKFPNLHEWIGARVIQNMSEHSYSILNKDYVQTVGVDRNDIKDDNLGIYSSMFEEMGMSVKALPDQLVFGALANGFTQPCFDGQNFFDVDHPRINADGAVESYSNMAAGASTPWFLLDVSRPVKPIIYQEREKFAFVARDKVDDDNVFFNKQFVYGTDGRCNVGYGFPQMAFGSKLELTAANYAAARAAIRGMKGDHGRPLGLGRKLLLVVPDNLEGQALEILNAERDAAGATNVWKGTAELLVTSWLN